MSGARSTVELPTHPAPCWYAYQPDNKGKIRFAGSFETEQLAKIAAGPRGYTQAVAVCSAENCKAPIIWVRTMEGRMMPVNAKPNFNFVPTGIHHETPKGVAPEMRMERTYMSHYATCPAAERFRRK